MLGEGVLAAAGAANAIADGGLNGKRGWHKNMYVMYLTGCCECTVPAYRLQDLEHFAVGWASVSSSASVQIARSPGVVLPHCPHFAVHSATLRLHWRWVLPWTHLRSALQSIFF